MIGLMNPFKEPKMAKLTKETREYFKKLNAILDEVWARFSGPTMDLAKSSGLNPKTVYRLGSRATKFPRLQTVFKLAKAVDMELELVARNIYRKAV